MVESLEAEVSQAVKVTTSKLVHNERSTKNSDHGPILPVVDVVNEVVATAVLTKV